MAGLSAAGFERKRLPQIKLEIENALKQAFGENIDLRAESVFGQLVGIFSLPIAEQWEEMENVWLAFDPDFAEGVSLDSLAALTGITRIPASLTTVIAAVTGLAATVIPAGSQVRNAQTGDVYSLTSNTTIATNNLLRARVGVDVIADATLYTITINDVANSITSASGSTANSILQELAEEIASNYAAVTAQVIGDEIVITSDDGETPFSISLTSNLIFEAVSGYASFQAVEAGQKFVPIGTLTEIQTPIAGWQSVTNFAEGTSGRNRESDPELRVRRRQSVSFPSTATIDAILSRLLQIPNVMDAVVIQNNTDTTDANGVPRQHIWAIVNGGANTDIADAIYRTIAGGIGTFGEETVTVTSTSGQPYDINFDRPTEIDLYIEMEILTNGGYPLDGEDQIKAAIVKWVTENVGIGDTLKYSRLYTPINSVAGFEVLDMTIGITPSPSGMDSIAVDPNELIIADASRITIVEAS